MYSRTITKIEIARPLEVIYPIHEGKTVASNMISILQDQFEDITFIAVKRKYWNADRGGI